MRGDSICPNHVCCSHTGAGFCVCHGELCKSPKPGMTSDVMLSFPVQEEKCRIKTELGLLHVH